jgi:O-succinylbenzoic acid--CoA ligase
VTLDGLIEELPGWQLLAADQERPAGEAALALAADRLPEGSGIVVGSGGSSGGRRWCLQPWSHLQGSGAACGQWLVAQGFQLAALTLVNPLPSHHLSGLMPQLRARAWGARLVNLSSAQLKQPAELLALQAHWRRPLLLSLVPTQLQRLLADPDGLAWLRGFDLIWVGGAALAGDLAARARQARLRLAPCYGATETAAMVCALEPERFLAGVSGCGHPFADCQLRLGAQGAIALNTPRLSPGWLQDGRLVPFAAASGWWSSGDGGRLTDQGLEVLGRLDGAINSGGETVFPEQVEQQLSVLAGAAGLPLEALLLVAEPDPLWGERLVGLFRPLAATNHPGATARLADALHGLARQLPPSQRPRRWLACPELAPSALGKWQRSHWQRWLVSA